MKLTLFAPPIEATEPRALPRSAFTEVAWDAGLLTCDMDPQLMGLGLFSTVLCAAPMEALLRRVSGIAGEIPCGCAGTDSGKTAIGEQNIGEVWNIGL